MNLDNGLQIGQVVDLSTLESCKKWLTEYALAEPVQQRLATMKRSHACKEVAVAWRGYIAKNTFEVLDNKGNFSHFLGEGRFLVTRTHM